MERFQKICEMEETVAELTKQHNKDLVDIKTEIDKSKATLNIYQAKGQKIQEILKALIASQQNDQELLSAGKLFPANNEKATLPDFQRKQQEKRHSVMKKKIQMEFVIRTQQERIGLLKEIAALKTLTHNKIIKEQSNAKETLWNDLTKPTISSFLLYKYVSGQEDMMKVPFWKLFTEVMEAHFGTDSSKDLLK